MGTVAAINETTWKVHESFANSLLTDFNKFRFGQKDELTKMAYQNSAVNTSNVKNFGEVKIWDGIIQSMVVNEITNDKFVIEIDNVTCVVRELLERILIEQPGRDSDQIYWLEILFEKKNGHDLFSDKSYIKYSESHRFSF
jgi:hypothetical protein